MLDLEQNKAKTYIPFCVKVTVFLIIIILHPREGEVNWLWGGWFGGFCSSDLILVNEVVTNTGCSQLYSDNSDIVITESMESYGVVIYTK